MMPIKNEACLHQSCAVSLTAQCTNNTADFLFADLEAFCGATQNGLQIVYFKTRN